MENLKKQNKDLEDLDIYDILKDTKHYLWVSALRNCWNTNEKNDVNKLYEKISKLLDSKIQKKSLRLEDYDNYELILE